MGQGRYDPECARHLKGPFLSVSWSPQAAGGEVEPTLAFLASLGLLILSAQ